MASSSESQSKPKSTEDIVIRLGTLSDATKIGLLAAKTYLHTSLSQYLGPHRFQHPADWERGFIQRTRGRIISPRNLTFVACPRDQPRDVVGYAQFIRVGDDAGAQDVIHRRSRTERFALFVLGYVLAAWYTVVGWWVGGDKSADPTAVKRFLEWNELEDRTHWAEEKFPERQNRYHAQSVVVGKEFQGKGIGKRLMREALARAERENVVVGLESSEDGEYMYRSVGFELLGRFQEDPICEEGHGGVMIYRPMAWREKSVKI